MPARAVTVERRGAKVRHLAAWVHDLPEMTLYRAGRWVPICGQQRAPGEAWRARYADEQPDRKICSRCLEKHDAYVAAVQEARLT